MYTTGMDKVITPTSSTETVIEILSGPRWNGGLRRWEWTFFAHWWDNSPAFCGKCGNCTNPNNVPPCGHPEAKRHVQGQIFVTNLEQFEKQILEDQGHSVRYVRDGMRIGAPVAKETA